MLVPSLLLAALGLLGAFDIAWFHSYRGRLVLRPECRREAWLHVVRGGVYAAQFLVIPNVLFRGWAVLLLAALLVLDVAVAVTDILVEPESRKAQGGLSGGEYLTHMILSVLAGAELCAVGHAVMPRLAEPGGLAVSTAVPLPLRVVLAVMALGALACAAVEALILVDRPRPIHVRVRLRASLERVWNVTQDHRLHPRWDRRFDRITMDHGEAESPLGMPDPRIGEGTTMTYEKSVLGVVIRGTGTYRLHKPLRQSTFAFGSEDVRSLIRSGVGLWLYRDVGGGVVEMSTSYTYDVRWGVFGRAFDALVFRPLFQRFTEASFRRLARDYFDDPAPRVLGRVGRRPATFELATGTDEPRLSAAG